MASSGVFSKLAVILTVNLFIQLHTADAGSIPAVSSAQDDVKNFLSTVCSNADSEPAVLCSKTIDFFTTKIQVESTPITEQFCELSAASTKLQFSSFKIDNILAKTVVQTYLDSFKDNCKKSTNEITSSLIDRVSKPLKKTCAEKTEDSLPKDKSGNKPKLCNGVTSSAKVVCSDIVNAGCEAIGTEQPEWSSLVPFCKGNLSKVICVDFLTAVESVVGKQPNTVANNASEPWTPSWTDRIFEHFRDAARYNSFPLAV